VSVPSAIHASGEAIQSNIMLSQSDNPVL